MCCVFVNIDSGKRKREGKKKEEKKKYLLAKFCFPSRHLNGSHTWREGKGGEGLVLCNNQFLLRMYTCTTKRL